MRSVARTIGTTPITSARLALAPYRYQLRKAGFEPLNKTDAGVIFLHPYRRLEYALVPIGSDEATPEGMVRVPGKALDSRLTVGQVIALRFASDDEFPALATRAAEHGTTPDEIKKSIKYWRADTHRV